MVTYSVCDESLLHRANEQTQQSFLLRTPAIKITLQKKRFSVMEMCVNF